jgi:hypothetical protein
MPFIVKAFDSVTPTKVVVDPPTGLMSGTFVTGDIVKSHGAVPYDIERAVQFLIMREVARQESWADGNAVDPSLIAGETTDKYSYKVFSPAQTIGFGKPPGITGVAEIQTKSNHRKNTEVESYEYRARPRVQGSGRTKGVGDRRAVQGSNTLQ